MVYIYIWINEYFSYKSLYMCECSFITLKKILNKKKLNNIVVVSNSFENAGTVNMTCRNDYTHLELNPIYR